MSPLVVVLNMFFIRSKQPQIAGLIIGLVAIAMMDDFSGFKVAANAFTAYPIHWYWILPRWTKKDMGHFELRPA
jgi:hypothetical protein